MNKNIRYGIASTIVLLLIIGCILFVVSSAIEIKQESLNQIKKTGSAVVNKINEVDAQGVIDETKTTIKEIREKAHKFSEERRKKKEGREER